MATDPKKVVLVTGAAGLIGRHLIEHLAALGFHVKALVRPERVSEMPVLDRVEVLGGDMCAAPSLHDAMEGVWAVVHLAARKSDEPDSWEVNVGGAKHLVEACRSRGVFRVVNVSTQSVKLHRLGSYGRTKREAERVLHDSALEVTTLRPSVVYGPDVTGVFARMRHFLLRLPVIPVIGDGHWPSRPIHVGDVSKAIAGCLNSPATIGKVYDLGGPDEVTMDEFLDAVGSAYGIRRRKLHIPTTIGLLGAHMLARLKKKPAVTVSNVLGSTQNTHCDPSRAVRDLGLEPEGLAAGLERVLDDEVRSRHRTSGSVLKMAVLGLGKMGLFHATLLRTIGGVRLVAAGDIEKRLEASMRSMGLQVPFFRSLEELLEKRCPDAVLICTPTFAHFEGVKCCLEHGVHVLVEKPLAENATRSRDLSDLADRQGVVHAVGYHLAYSPVFQRARELLRDGVVGDVCAYRSLLQHGEVLGPKRGWMFDPKLAGGGLVRNTASHLIFLLEWFFGCPSTVTAAVRSIHSDSIEDTATATLEYSNGLVGALDASWSVPGKNILEVEIDVDGSLGSLKVNAGEIWLDLKAPTARFSAGSHRIHASDIETKGVFDLAPEAGGAAYFRQDEGFVREVVTGGRMRTAFDVAARAEAVIDAIYRSAERAEKVSLRQ